MGLFRKSYCPCGSGKERGFCPPCSHGARRRVPTAITTGSGKRTRVRQVDMRSTAARTPAWPWQK